MRENWKCKTALKNNVLLLKETWLCQSESRECMRLCSTLLAAGNNPKQISRWVRLHLHKEIRERNLRSKNTSCIGLIHRQGRQDPDKLYITRPEKDPSRCTISFTAKQRKDSSRSGRNGQGSKLKEARTIDMSASTNLTFQNPKYLLMFLQKTNYAVEVGFKPLEEHHLQPAHENTRGSFAGAPPHYTTCHLATRLVDSLSLSRFTMHSCQNSSRSHMCTPA